MQLQLSPDQQAAIDAIRAWLTTSTPTLTMGGLAGTGKSTLISQLVQALSGMIVYVCAFTGKAASVLRSKGIPACTMHSLIYEPRNWCDACQRFVESNGKTCSSCFNGAIRTKFVPVPFIDADLVIVDESSMLNLNHVRDLEALAPKILYVGDHGQLEPIGRDPGIMRDPDIKLERIHRQAESSPIVQFAHHVRLQRSPSSWSPPLKTQDENQETTVVNIKYQDYDVYIGRAGNGQDGYFGNPCKLNQLCKYCSMTHEWPTATIPCYRRYFEERIAQDDEFKKRVGDLAGKRLGCFCKPNACHGDIIAEYVNGLSPNTEPDEVVIHRDRPTGKILNKFDIVICGYNNTRVAVNGVIRKLRGFKDPLPEVGERLICLQNDSDLGLFNGLLVTVLNRHPQSYRWDYPKYDFVDDTGNEYFGIPVNPDQFGKEKRLERARKGVGVFDWGYCMTCHKCQGSEFDKVAVLEQIAGSWESARWRYTAATRAAKRLEWWVPGGRR